MRSFQHAVDLGYRYLETDAHLTSDGVLVSFHDDHLDRVTDRSGAIAELNWRDVEAAVVGESDRVPRLSDLLEAFPDVCFNIDPKHDEALEPLLELIRAHNALDRVCITAFSDVRIARARGLIGEALCTGLGPREIARLVGAARGLGWMRTAGYAAQVPIRHRNVTIVTPRFVKAAHRRGLQVHVWTIDEPSEMHRLLDLGVDGLMTDRAEVLRDVLAERGQWHPA